MVAIRRTLTLSKQVFLVRGKLPGMNEILSSQRIEYKRRFGRSLSANQGNKTQYSELKREWTQRIKYEALSQRIKHIPLVFIQFIWFERCHTKNGRDPDNIQAGTKFILDGLVEADVIDDDSRSVVVGLYHDFVYKAPYYGVAVILFEQRDA